MIRIIRYILWSGKTTWARKYAAEHPEKKYEIINAAIYLEKATVNGESRKAHTQVRFTTVPRLKRRLTRFSTSGFFHKSIVPKPLSNSLKIFEFCFEFAEIFANMC
jgi:hypothetical protein